MNSTVKDLIKAEKKAELLFKEIERRDILIPGNSEEKINSMIFDLAFEMFGIKHYWHKRIVRCGENTLFPYNEDPINLTLKDDDILFLDFGLGNCKRRVGTCFRWFGKKFYSNKYDENKWKEPMVFFFSIFFFF